MAKQPKHGLKQTKGEFKLKGIVVTGEFKETDSFGKKKTEYKFGVKTSENNTPYLKTGDKEQEEAFFYSKEAKATERVPFANRNEFKKEGYNLIGTTIGLEKDSEGNNVSKTIHTFDTPKYLNEKLKDGMSVFVTGEFNFYSFDGKDGKVTMKELIPKRIYGSKGVNFEADDFVEENAFKQKIVFNSIEKVEDEYELSAYIIGFMSIEKVTFKVKDAKFASVLKKNLKAGYAIDVVGTINNERVEVEADKSDSWGEDDPFKRTTEVKREFVIKGALPDTLDKETYSIEVIQQKIKEMSEAKKEYGKTKEDKENEESWGDSGSFEDGDDDDSSDFPF